MKIRTITVVYIFIGWLLVFPLNPLGAQPNAITLTKGRVMAVLDTLSGRFGTMRADGKTLLFASGTGLTSHVSIAIDNVIWTNYGKSQMTAAWPIRNLGRGQSEILADRLRYTWELRARGGTVRIVLDLEPVSDSLYEEVRIHLAIENGGSYGIGVGMTVMEDVDADGDDYVTLRSVSGPITKERAYSGESIPERVTMLSSSFLPDSAYCRFQGPGVTTPDRMTVGRWTYHGFLGTAVYGYEAKNQPIGDAAVLTQWDKAELAAGNRREEATAIGFAAPLPDPPGFSMFSREYIIPMAADHIVLSIVSDSDAVVSIRAPFCDAIYENSSNPDNRWDTTVTVSRDQPGCLAVWLKHKPKHQTDSLTFYRQLFVSVSSDREIGIIVRPQAEHWGNDASSVLPVAGWDSACLYHGVLTGSDAGAFIGSTTTRFTLVRTIEYFWNDYCRLPNGHLQPIIPPLDWEIPAYGSLLFETGTGRFFDHWSPRRMNDRNLTIDGAGDVLIGSSSFLLTNLIWSRIWPGYDIGPMILPPSQYSYFHHPTRKELGTEYVFVPFRKRKAKRQEDFIRIIAYEDGTDITLQDGTPPIQLNRSGHVDTLLSQPTLIRSSKPVAVYQHHLSWIWLESDTTFAGGAFPLLPHGLWGHRYYSVTDDQYKSNVAPLVSKVFQDGRLHYDDLYLILITKAIHRSDVSINDVSVDASRFTVFGDWAYAYVDISPGYHVVKSDYPFLAVSCGGGHGEGEPNPSWLKFGVSYIPPYK